MPTKPAILRFLKYSGIGTSTFLLDLTLLFFLTSILEIQYLVAAGTSFALAVSLNYFISRRFVFTGTERPLAGGYVRFILIAATGVGFVVGAMYVFVTLLAINFFVARIMVAGVTGLWNYLMNLYVNFQVAGKY